MNDRHDKPSCPERHNPESASNSITAAFLLVTIIAASLFLYSCNLVNGSSDDRGGVGINCSSDDRGGVGINCSSDDRGGVGIIVPGKSIDGVKLGDSRELVEELLGEPSGSGWADGQYRGWRTYWYKPQGSEGLGFTILFIYQGEDKPWGPVDALRAHQPYDGKTPEGIGIGSTLDEVRRAYGEPDDIPSDVVVDGTHRLQYTYCHDAVKFTIGMNDEVVIGFFIGFYKPIEQDQTYQCK